MTTRFRTLDQVRAFVEGTAEVEFSIPSRSERLACVAQTLAEFSYWRLGKREKGLLVRFLRRITGYSRQQLTRHIARYRTTGRIEDRRKGAGQAVRHTLYGPGRGLAGRS